MATIDTPSANITAWIKYPEEVILGKTGVDYFNQRRLAEVAAVSEGRNKVRDLVSDRGIIPVYNWCLDRVIGEMESELSPIELDVIETIREKLKKLKEGGNEFIGQIVDQLQIPFGTGLREREHVVRSLGRRVAWLKSVLSENGDDYNWKTVLETDKEMLDDALGLMDTFVREAGKNIEEPYLTQYELHQKRKPDSSP